MTTVVQAAPDGARSTALALRLTGNRLGQVAAPAAAGLVAGVAGVAAPFVMLGALLLLSAGSALRAPAAPGGDQVGPDRIRTGARSEADCAGRAISDGASGDVAAGRGLDVKESQVKERFV